MAIELASTYVSLTASARGLRRQITDEFDHVERSASDAGDRGGRRFGANFGAALAGVGAGAGLAIGAALVKGTVDAINAGQAADQLAAGLGITDPAEIERLGRIQGEVYADAYGESLGEVGDAIAAINNNIGDIDTIDDAGLEALIERSFDAAGVLDEEVGRAVRGAGQLFRTGLAADAEEGFDAIVATAQRLPQEMRGELIDTVEEYSSSFAELGLTGEQALAAVSNAVAAGARNTDLAADAFKELSIRAIDGSTLTAEAFEALGFDAEEMARRIAAGGPAAADATSEIIQAISGVGDEVAQEQIGVALFGTKFEDLGADVIAAMDPAAASLGDFAGAAEEAGDIMNDNLATRFEALKRRGFQALARVAEATVIPMLEGLFDLAEPLGPVFDSLISGITSFANTLRTGFTEDEGTPIERLALQIRENVLPLLPKIVEGIQRIITEVGPILAQLLAIVGDVVRLAVALWNQFGDEILAVLIPVFDTVVRVVRAALDIVQGVIRLVTAVIEGDWDAAWEAIKQIFAGVWDAVVAILDGAIALIDEIITIGLDAIWFFLSEGWSAAADVVSDWVDNVVEFVESLPGRVADAARGMWDGISDAFQAMVDAVKRIWNDTVGGFSISIPDWVPEFGGRGFTIPRLHDGGVVPGPPGSEHLYILEAGETVTSADDSRRMAAVADAGHRGDGITIGNVYVHDRPWLEEFREHLALRPVA